MLGYEAASSVAICRGFMRWMLHFSIARGLAVTDRLIKYRPLITRTVIREFAGLSPSNSCGRCGRYFVRFPNNALIPFRGRCARSPYMIFWVQMSLTPLQAEKIELPKGYELEVAGNNLLLKRPNRFLIAAFGEAVKLDSIQRVAEADERYMRAFERQERFGSGADSETVLLFAEDVKETRTEFLLALEAAYRE